MTISTINTKNEVVLRKSLEIHYNEFHKHLSCRQMVDPNHIFVAATNTEGEIFYSTSIKNLYNIQSFVQNIKKQYAVLNLGDAVLTNDPSSGTMHIKDHYLASPFYNDGNLGGYVIIGSQLADVGGMNLYNYFPYAKDLFQEGVRTTPILLARSGNIDKDVMELQKLNSRLPVLMEHDLKLMYRIVTSMSKDMGIYYTNEIAKTLINKSKHCMEQFYSLLSDHSRRLKSTISNVGGDDVEISFDVTVIDGHLNVSFLAVDELQRGFVHSTLATTSSTVASALIQMTDCIPNSGVTSKIIVEVEEQSLLNCSYLKPVGWSPYSPYLEIKSSLMDYFGRFSTPKKRIYSKNYRPTVAIAGINLL